MRRGWRGTHAHTHTHWHTHIHNQITSSTRFQGEEEAAGAPPPFILKMISSTSLAPPPFIQKMISTTSLAPPPSPTPGSPGNIPEIASPHSDAPSPHTPAADDTVASGDAASASPTVEVGDGFGLDV